MKALGEARLFMAWNDPLTSDSKEPFCACVVFSLILFSDRVLPLFVHAKIITWMFTRDKDWLLTLFLLLLQFPRANRGLVVNSSTGTHLSVASGNAERRLAVNFQPGTHLSLTSLVP